MNTHAPRMMEAPLCNLDVRPQLTRPERIAREDPGAGKQTRRRLIIAAASAPVRPWWEALHLLSFLSCVGRQTLAPVFSPTPLRLLLHAASPPTLHDSCLPTSSPQYPGISGMQHCKIPKDSFS